MREQLEFQKLLAGQLTELRLRNPAYSLRAFARKAGVTPSALSEVLNGKRRVSRELARKVMDRLALAPNESEAVLSHFPPSARKRQTMARSGAAATTASPARQPAYTAVDMDHFRAISDWYHFAILSLSETTGYRHDASWIARRLGISKSDAAGAIGRLERLGMLVKSASGKVRPGAPRYITSDGIANLSLRKAHAQNLELARRSLENDPVEARDFTAMTMAIDPARLPEAKKLIREFRDRLCEFLEGGDKKEVHKLCVQLIPLTKERDT